MQASARIVYHAKRWHFHVAHVFPWGTIIGLCLAGSAGVADSEKYLAKIW